MPSVYGPVLVIDDDAAVRNSLKFALELEGLDVRLYEAAAHLLGEGAMPGPVASSSTTGCPAWTASRSSKDCAAAKWRCPPS